MSWQMAVVGAIGAVTASQQNAYGKFNEDINDRNAIAKEQEAKIIEDKLVLDLATFDKKFRQLEAKTKVNALKSGVTFEGTAQRIKMANLREAEIEKSKMKYDAEIGKARAFEQANFARMQGNLARMEARQAELGYYAKAGESLLRMYG